MKFLKSFSIWYKAKSFGVSLYLARKWGWYKYEGIISFAESRGYPMARVKYADGVSSPMAIGNAVDYAEIFKGEVIPL